MKVFLQKGRAPKGMVLPAATQATVNQIADKSTLEKFGQGAVEAKPNIVKVEATVKDLKPMMTAPIPTAVELPTVETPPVEPPIPAPLEPEDTSPGSESKKSKGKHKPKH